MRQIATGLILIVVAILTESGSTLADVTTPASNLAGVRGVQERIDVTLKLKGAEEFGVEANEVIKIIRSTLNSSGISMAKGDHKVPSVHVAIIGKSTGGGGAEFTVELIVRALLSSPFAKERSIEAIIWRNSITDHHLMHYEPASKSMIKPSGAIKDRVYNVVRQVATYLTEDVKISQSI